MFENEKRGKNIFRGVIIVNVICLIALIFYTCNLIFLSFLYDEEIAKVNKGMTLVTLLHPNSTKAKEEKADEAWSTLSWFFIFFSILTLVGIQTTMDLDMLMFRLGPDELDTDRMKRVRHWLTMSTWFMFLAAMAFTTSLFIGPKGISETRGQGHGHVHVHGHGHPHLTSTPNRPNPLTMFILGFGGLILRFVLLYIGHQYWSWLKRRGGIDSFGGGGIGGVIGGEQRLVMTHVV